MIADNFVHWISWNTGVPNNFWNWHAGWTIQKHQLRQSWHRSLQQHAGQVVLYQQCYLYCWSRKTLVAIHWMHLRVNLTCIKSFCPQKLRITACCSLRDDFNDYVAIFNVYKWCHSDVIIIKLIADTQNYIPYKVCISDFLYLEK